MFNDAKGYGFINAGLMAAKICSRIFRQSRWVDSKPSRKARKCRSKSPRVQKASRRQTSKLPEHVTGQSGERNPELKKAHATSSVERAFFSSTLLLRPRRKSRCRVQHARLHGRCHGFLLPGRYAVTAAAGLKPCSRPTGTPIRKTGSRAARLR